MSDLPPWVKLPALRTIDDARRVLGTNIKLQLHQIRLITYPHGINLDVARDLYVACDDSWNGYAVTTDTEISDHIHANYCCKYRYSTMTMCACRGSFVATDFSTNTCKKCKNSFNSVSAFIGDPPKGMV